MGYTLNTIDKIWIANLQTDMWTDKIDANYELAIEYYRQRKELFVTYWANQLSHITTKNISDFITQGTKQASGVYNTITSKYWPTYDSLNLPNIPQMPQETTKQYKKRVSQLYHGITMRGLKKDTTIQQFAQNGILPANFFAPNSNFWANLGKVLEEQTGPGIEKDIKNTIGSNVNKLVADFTGSITGTSAIKGSGDKKYVTIDTLIYDKTNTTVDRTKATINGFDFELQQEIYLSNYSDVSRLILSNPELAVWLNQNYTGGIGGINTKSFSWTTVNNQYNYNHKKFISSIQMQQHLNGLLKEVGKTRLRYTTDWVQLFVIFYLSERLINIISPGAVIFQTKDQWQWFSDVLKNVYFYMATNKQKTEPDKVNPSDIQEENKTGFGKEWSKFSVIDDTVRFLAKQKSSLVLKNSDFANQKLIGYNDPTIEIKMKKKYTRNNT